MCGPMPPLVVVRQLEFVTIGNRGVRIPGLGVNLHYTSSTFHLVHFSSVKFNFFSFHFMLHNHKQRAPKARLTRGPP